MSVAEQPRTAATRSRWAWWLTILALGPVTGLLVNLCVGNIHAHRPAMAAVCVVAMIAFWIGAPTLLMAELNYLRLHGLPSG